jgi:hypothetical protein
MSRFAKVYGLRVSLDEVEAFVAAGRARGVAVSDDEAVYVVFTDPVDGPSIARALASEYKLPDVVFHAHQRDDLPTLPSGKVDYQKPAQGRPRARRRNEDIGDSSDKAIEAAFVPPVPARRRTTAGQLSSASGGDSTELLSPVAGAGAGARLPAEGWEAAERRRTVRDWPCAPSRLRWWTAAGARDRDPVAGAARSWRLRGANHVSDLVVGGGAEVLLMLAGYNLARYQKPRLERGAHSSSPGPSPAGSSRPTTSCCWAS